MGRSSRKGMGLMRRHSHRPLLFALIIKLEWQVTLLVVIQDVAPTTTASCL